MRKSILISDMSKCEPSGIIADRGREGCWWKADYELQSGEKGVMLYAEPKDKPGELRLKLDAKGAYRIYVGMNYTFQNYQNGHTDRLLEMDYGAVFLRLSNDRGFTRIGIEKLDARTKDVFKEKTKPEKATKEHFNTIYEAYWKTAELDDQELIISAPKEPYDNQYYGQVANISFLRLVPADEDDMDFEKRLMPSDDTRKLTALWCSGAISGHTSGQTMYHPTTREWFETEVQPYRDGDFDILCIEAMRGNLCCFKTAKGDVGTEDNSWPEEWVDPLKEFTVLGHDAGMKVFAALRMIGGSRPYSRYPINWARFFWDNLLWAKRDREGEVCGSLSIAYKEVRDHWLSLMEEALERGIDGLQLHLNRCSPFVMYEEPAVADYIKKYSADPRTIPEDISWRRHTAGYMTMFVEEIRRLLDKKENRQLALMVEGYDEFLPGTPGSGVDAEELLKRGLVDYIYLESGTDPRYIEHFKKLGGGRVKVYFDLMPRTQPGEAYVDLAKKLYEMGADGFTLWDCERRVQRISEWAVIKHLGKKHMLQEIRERAAGYYNMHRIKKHKGLNAVFSYKDG